MWENCWTNTRLTGSSIRYDGNVTSLVSPSREVDFSKEISAKGVYWSYVRVSICVYVRPYMCVASFVHAQVHKPNAFSLICFPCISYSHESLGFHFYILVISHICICVYGKLAYINTWKDSANYRNTGGHANAVYLTFTQIPSGQREMYPGTWGYSAVIRR